MARTQNGEYRTLPLPIMADKILGIFTGMGARGEGESFSKFK